MPIPEGDNELDDVHFGTTEAAPVDWREDNEADVDDDEELSETPPDVIEMLGFDPLTPDDDAAASAE